MVKSKINQLIKSNLHLFQAMLALWLWLNLRKRTLIVLTAYFYEVSSIKLQATDSNLRPR